MIPDQVLSTDPIGGLFLPPRGNRGSLDLLIDYERGGTDIGDATDGLQVKDWTGQYIGNNVVLSAPAVAPVTVLTVPGITELAFTFDQQMRVFVAYMVGANGFFYWFDTVGSAYTTTALPGGSVSPRCSLDDKRQLQTSTSDIILAYVRAGRLRFLAQRDRYDTEYDLGPVPGQVLSQCGMSDVNRFQFLMKPEP